MKLSDYLSKYLEDYTKDIFLIPGGGCIHIVDSLSKSKINLIANLHEQAAAICAESYAQFTNKIGVVLVTTGPGATNALTGIASAWLDSVPVLIITGQVQSKDRATGKGVRQLGFQEINSVAIYKNITKYAQTIEKPETIKFHLKKALHLATTGRPGPVLLDIPLDIQAAEIDENNLEDYNPIDNKDSLDLSNMMQELQLAKRPILLVGNGTRLAHALPECLEFIRKTNIPVLTTWKTLDILMEDDPQYVGRPGGVGQRGANFNQQNSDFIICVGARLDHGQLAYQSKYFARAAKKCIVDVDVNEINKLECHIDYPINTDAKNFFNHANKIATKLHTAEWLKLCKTLHEKYPVVLPEYLDPTISYVNNYAFIHYLSLAIPDNCLIVPGSSGACSEVTMQSFTVCHKNIRIYNSEGLGSMGFGVPAAIGGCIANNKDLTICIDGDGGFVMNIQELELVDRYKLPIKFFILNNNGYGSIKNTQKTHFQGRLVASDPQSGLTLPSIEKQAYAYNIPFYRIVNQYDIQNKIETIINTNGPSICEIMVDQNHITQPKASVYKKKDGSFCARPMEDLAPFLNRQEFLSNLLVEPIQYDEE